MARAPLEEPEGLVYRPELLTLDEERKLLEILRELRFDPIVMHGAAARRVARHYGLGYDYATRTPREGEPMSGPARASWQHSIPPTKEERYSVTFRTLRRAAATSAASSPP